MVANIVIKQVTQSDLEALIRISLQTYHETFFGLFDNEEQYQNYVDDSFSADRLNFELNDPDSLFYFVYLQDHIIGYYKLNFGSTQTIFQGTKAAEIQHIYLLKNYQHKQIGKLLLQHAVTIAKKHEANYLWLVVWDKNHNAINFYKSNGLSQFNTHNYDVAGEAQTDLLMRIEFE